VEELDSGRLRRALHRYGVWGLVQLGATRMRRGLFERRSVILFRASPETLTARATSAGNDFRVLSRSEAATVQPGSEPLRHLLMASVSDGPDSQELHLVYREGSLAGWGISFVGSYEWPIPEVGAKVRLESDDAVLTSFYIIPEYRGKKLYQALMSEMAIRAARRGVRRITIWCDADNLPSRAAIERVGFKKASTFRCMTLLGARIRLPSALNSE
jgi:RimJ/RimL family protein N-acetyltransferase